MSISVYRETARIMMWRWRKWWRLSTWVHMPSWIYLPTAIRFRSAENWLQNVRQWSVPCRSMILWSITREILRHWPQKILLMWCVCMRKMVWILWHCTAELQERQSSRSGNINVKWTSFPAAVPLYLHGCAWRGRKIRFMNIMMRSLKSAVSMMLPFHLEMPAVRDVSQMHPMSVRSKS